MYLILDYLLVRNLLLRCFTSYVCLITTESSVHKAIKVKDFAEQVAVEIENKEKCLEEFDLLATNVPFTQHAAKLHCNKAKNRYNNIVPCKFSTVLCSNEDGYLFR